MRSSTVIALAILCASAAPAAATTVTITPSTSSIALGPSATVTYSLTVTGGNTSPAGTFTLFEDGAPVASCSNIALPGLPAGNTSSGSCNITYAGQDAQHGAGIHMLFFAYTSSNTNNWASANSPTVQVTVTPATPAISVPAANPASPLVYGQQTSITVTVTGLAGGPTPTGKVNFYDGATLLNTPPISLVTSTATLPSVKYSVGAHSISASYLGDVNYSSITSALSNLQVNRDSTTTTLSAGTSQTYGIGQPMTATVVANAPGSGNPTGTVTFSSGSTALGNGTLVCAAQCVATTTLINQLTPSNIAYGLMATYNSDANFQGSASANSSSVTVSKNTVTGALTTNPAATASLRAPVTLSATFAPAGGGAGTPTGTVTFYDLAPGSSTPASIGSATLNGSGVATTATSALAAGSHTLSASYAGDVNFASLAQSAGPAAALNIASAPLTISLPAANPASPLVYNQPTSIAVTVTSSTGGPLLTGKVNFYDGATLLNASPISLAASTATLPSATYSVGAHSISASYLGDAIYSPITSAPLSLQVNRDSTTTTLTAPASLTYGIGQSMTATVVANAPGSGNPTGTVTFSSGNTALGNGALSCSNGNCTTSATLLNQLTPSDSAYGLTATYNGDANFLGSTANSKVTVLKNSVTGTLTTNPVNTGSLGAPVTLTATFVPASSGTGTPTGTVTFYDLAPGSSTPASIGSATLNGSGVAIIATSALAAGSHTLSASYAGDTNFASLAQSAGPAAALNIAQPATLSITCSPCTGSGAIGQISTVGSISVSTSDPNQPITFSVSTASGGGFVPRWLSVSPASGTAGASAATITLTANLQGFAPGTYSASVTVTATGGISSALRAQAAGGGSATVSFSLTAQGSDSLQITYSPNVGQSLQLTSAGTASGSIAVTSSNTAIPGMYFSAGAAVLTPPGGNWLSIVQNGSQTNATVSVSLQRGSLSPGTYRGSVVLLDTFNNQTSVPVVFIVPPPPTLSASCTQSCSGSGVTGQAVSLGSLSVATSDPTQPISFSVTPGTTNSIGPSWLTVGYTSATAGATPATIPLVAYLTDLAQGTYTGSVILTPTSPAANGAQTVTATVTVTNGALQVTWSAGALQNQASSQVLPFTAPSALSGTIDISASAALSYSYQVQPAVSWLHVSPLPPPAPGSLTPGILTLTANPAGLQPGTYQAQVDLVDSANNATPVNVALTVPGPPALTADTKSLTFAPGSGGAIPPPQVVNLTATDGSHLGFSVTPSAGWFSVTASQSTTPAVLTVGLASPLPASNLTGTIALKPAPDNGSAPVTINVAFSIGPVISGVANATDGAAAIAQNTWIAITGTNLSQTTRTWGSSDFLNGQMPTQLDGVSATVNNNPAFVYYISPTQINILTPLDSATGPVPVQVKNNLGTSGTVNAAMMPYAPGFFIFYAANYQYPAAEHANGSLLGVASLYPGQTTPAQPGETIVLYGAGFGLVSPAIVNGSETQSGLLPTPWPAITIGNLPATVIYAALISPGLYQLNVTVPASAPNGDNALSATYNGAATQSGLFVTVQQQ